MSEIPSSFRPGFGNEPLPELTGGQSPSESVIEGANSDPANPNYRINIENLNNQPLIKRQENKRPENDGPPPLDKLHNFNYDGS